MLQIDPRTASYKPEEDHWTWKLSAGLPNVANADVTIHQLDRLTPGQALSVSQAAVNAWCVMVSASTGSLGSDPSSE